MVVPFVIGNSTVHTVCGKLGPAMVTDSVENSISLLVSLVVGFVSYLCLYRWLQRNSLGPKNWPILGCLLEIRSNSSRIHDWVFDYMKKSPNATVCASVLGQTFLWIGRPDNVEFVLKSNFENFPKSVLLVERYEQFIGNGIFLLNGDVWKQHRKIASFGFTSRKLRDFSTDVYREHALRLVRILDGATIAGKDVDFQDLALRMTLDSICKVGFGMEHCALSPELPDTPFGKSFDNASVLVQSRQFGLTWKIKRMLDVGSEKKLRQEVEILDAFTFGLISQRRAELKALEDVGKELDMSDLLSKFMTARGNDGKLLTDRVLRDTILNIMMAGRDTSAITLTWFVYCLCCNPQVAEKCYEEMLAVIGEPRDSTSFDEFAKLLTYESLGKLNYLHAALTETLRLYPAVPRDAKHALDDCVLPDGTFVKSGSLVSFHPYAMGRLESLWGPDALQFRPERWLKDGVFHQESFFKFTAFQAGPRVCIGKDAAYLQMKMTAALLLWFFTIELVPNHPIHYRVSAVMPLRHGLRITLSRQKTVS